MSRTRRERRESLPRSLSCFFFCYTFFITYTLASSPSAPSPRCESGFFFSFTRRFAAVSRLQSKIRARAHCLLFFCSFGPPILHKKNE